MAGAYLGGSIFSPIIPAPAKIDLFGHTLIFILIFSIRNDPYMAFFSIESTFRDPSILVFRYGNSGQSGDVHWDTSLSLPFMHQRQYFRIALALSVAFCFPCPDRKGCKEQSLKVQFATSLYDHPAQLRHLSRIANLLLSLTVFGPSLPRIEYLIKTSYFAFSGSIRCFSLKSLRSPTRYLTALPSLR